MDAKKWLWILIVCLAIVAAYQIVKLTGGDSAEPSSPQAEQAVEADHKPEQTASLGELPSMPEQPMIEPAKVEEQEQTSAAIAEDSDPDAEEQEPDTVEPAETAEVAKLQEPPLPEIDQPVIETIPQSRAADAPVRFPNKGLVRGIVYSAERGSALIDETIVRTGGTVDGVKIVRIHAGGVDFEKDGRKWTQKVGDTPGPQWR